MSVGTLASNLEEKNGRPAHVTFRTIEKHLPKQSEREGRYVSKDVDVAEVRQLGSVDSIVWEVEKFFKHNEQEVRSERLNPAHEEFYKKSYQRWKEGQEIPIEGTPIKTWPILAPSQVSNLLHLNIRTVEDLATLTDEGVKRIGMGGVELKQKAKNWLAAAQDKGKLTQEMSSMQKQNQLLEANVKTLTAQVEELKAMVKAQEKAEPTSPAITASDLLEDEPKPKRGK